MRVKKPIGVTQNEALTEKASTYLGKERIKDLDQEIERLYRAVETEFSVANEQRNEDAELALKTLKEAQKVIFEDRRRYEEALYKIAVVRSMLARQRAMQHWSYTWGSFIFGYAVVWLIIFVIGFLLTDFLLSLAMPAAGTPEIIGLIRLGWFSMLAGGVGGAIGILDNLYRHVAIKQDFNRRYVRDYLLQPLKGVVLGLIVHTIVGAVALLWSGLPPLMSSSDALSPPEVGGGWGGACHLVTTIIQLDRRLSSPFSIRSGEGVIQKQELNN